MLAAATAAVIIGCFWTLNGAAQVQGIVMAREQGVSPGKLGNLAPEAWSFFAGRADTVADTMPHGWSELAYNASYEVSEHG